MPVIKAKITIQREVELKLGPDATADLPGIIRQRCLAPDDHLSFIEVTHADTAAELLPVRNNVAVENWPITVQQLQSVLRMQTVEEFGFEAGMADAESRYHSVALPTTSAALTAPTSRQLSLPDYLEAKSTSGMVQSDYCSLYPVITQVRPATSPSPNDPQPLSLFNVDASASQANGSRKSDRTLRYESRTTCNLKKPILPSSQVDDSEERRKINQQLAKKAKNARRHENRRKGRKDATIGGDPMDSEFGTHQTHKKLRIASPLMKESVGARVVKRESRDTRKFQGDVQQYGVTRALELRQRSQQSFRQQLRREADENRWASGLEDDANVDIITNSIKGLATRSSDDYCSMEVEEPAIVGENTNPGSEPLKPGLDQSVIFNAGSKPMWDVGAHDVNLSSFTIMQERGPESVMELERDD